ncbi:MAG: transglycosylase domain-containing protein [Bacillota bacterium]|nr:transglycosylase domain-containing protein [Bacillota bacterium]
MSTNHYDDNGSHADMTRASRVQRHGKSVSATVPADEVNSSSGSAKSSGSQKKKKKKKSKKSGVGRVIKFLLLAILAAIVIAAIAVTVMVVSIVSNAEDIDPNNIYSILSENSVMYDSQGTAIENVMDSELRTNLEYEEMPKQLVDAFVAIEDKTFWEHSGFNYVRIIGAVWESITTGGNISGTSTITQQLARNVFLPESKSERSMTRKIEEAYYTVILERNLTKEQIIEAYLNTIYLGFNTYGVEAASQTYFGKSASQLSLAECSALATIPKNPSGNALIKRYYSDEIDATNANIIATQGEYTLVYNESFKPRQSYVLKFMVEQGKATQEEADAAYAYNLIESLNPPDTINNSSAASSYFTDFAKDEAIEILMSELNLTEAEAQRKLYTGGLSIYTSLNPSIQYAIETAYGSNANFPVATSFRKDANGNALNSDGSIMLYDYNSFFDGNGDFVLYAGQYGYDDAGNLYLYKNNRLNFYNVKSNGNVVDIAINFKPMYLYKDSILHISSGGTIDVDSAYKTFDADRNLVIQKAFLDSNPNVFVSSGDNLIISKDYFSVNAEVVQPQSAMVIIDQYTGQIAGMVGGRNIQGNKLYNRAESPRQLGSSTKPLAVYTPALLKGFTGATIIPDTPNYVDGKLWPKNSYKGYKGNITLRKAVQSSSNVAAVRMINYLGYDDSISLLEEMGITTLCDDDKNPAALGLGGLTKGIKPLEACGAYSVLANGGTYYKPTTITKILDRNGGVIYEYQNVGKEVIDEGTAFCMTDILVSAVTGGTGSRARIYSNNSTIPVAGKTGTTTKNYDAWFCGYTPYFTAVVWIGNDYNIQLSNGSGAAARLWSTVMTQVHAGLPAKSFEKPDSVTRTGGDYAVTGRDQPGTSGKASYTICTESGLLARKGCPNVSTVRESVFAPRPTHSCSIHSDEPVENPDDIDNPDDTGEDPDNPGGETDNPETPDNPGGNTDNPQTPDNPPPVIPSDPNTSDM